MPHAPGNENALASGATDNQGNEIHQHTNEGRDSLMMLQNATDLDQSDKQESALDRLLTRHEESRHFDIPIDEGPDPRFPAGREPWADPDRDFVAIKQKDCMVMSVPLYTTLGRHNGIRFTGTDDRIRPAFVSADLRRRLSEAQPHIVLEKYAKVGTGQIMEMIKGSQVEMEVSEAVRLAHDLLLLVDLALGTSDGPVLDEIHDGPSLRSTQSNLPGPLTADQIIVEASMRGVKASTVLAERTADQSEGDRARALVRDEADIRSAAEVRESL